MKKFITIAAAATTLMIMAQAPAAAGPMSGVAAPAAASSDAGIVHKTGRRGRRIAAGIALGVLGAVAAGAAYSHYDKRRYYESRWERRCRRWRRRCYRGNDRACWKFERRC